MRAVQLADIEAAARVLMAVPVVERAGTMASLLQAADIADRYRKRLRRPHPHFGTGTLMSAAAKHAAAPRPARLTPDALQAFATVVAVLAHQSA